MGLPQGALEAYDYLERTLQGPSGYLVIQTSTLEQSSHPDVWMLDEDLVPIGRVHGSGQTWCHKSSDQPCQAVLFLDDDIETIYDNIKLTLSSKVQEPIVLEGVVIRLLDYEEPGSDPTDLFFSPLARGGGGHYSPFELSDSPLPPPRDNVGPGINYSTQDPTSAIGSSLVTELSCKEEYPECPDYLFLQDQNDLEGLQLRLSFLRTLPPGWYDFEIRVKFTYDGKSYDLK